MLCKIEANPKSLVIKTHIILLYMHASAHYFMYHIHLNYLTPLELMSAVFQFIKMEPFGFYCNFRLWLSERADISFTCFQNQTIEKKTLFFQFRVSAKIIQPLLYKTFLEWICRCASHLSLPPGGSDCRQWKAVLYILLTLLYRGVML